VLQYLILKLVEEEILLSFWVGVFSVVLPHPFVCVACCPFQNEGYVNRENQQ